MAERLHQRDLRNHNARVIDAVVAGTTYIVTRNGEPVAELRPFTQKRRTFVPRRELLAAASESVPIDLMRFRADLDAAIDQRL